ncbi:12600_t:CDS:1, partial [Acaulospora morrowiae]
NQTSNSSSHKETSQSEKLDHSITLNHVIKVYQEAQIRQNWPNPFEIDFLNIKEPNNVATISYRIGDLIISYAILDTGANDSLYTGNIPEYLGIKIDKKNVHKLTGAVGDSQYIGISYNVPITIDTKENSITVLENEISVIPTKKD